MKTQSKPIVAFAAGAFLLTGALCQSAHAQGVWTSNTVSLAAANNNPADAISVQYVVAYSGTGLDGDYGTFTYTYDVFNPSADTAHVGSFEVSFNASKPGAATTITGGLFGQNDGSTGVTWQLNVAPGGNSGNLQFESIYSPDLSTANATGSPNPPAGWASLPNGSLVGAPNPPVVPEPASLSLMALTLLGAAFRSKKAKNS
jgi:hypothetical protein